MISEKRATYACTANRPRPSLRLAPGIYLAGVFVFVGHLGGGAQWTLSTYGLQILVPDRIRGRIFAFDEGFITLDSWDRFPECMAQLHEWVDEGRLRSGAGSGRRRGAASVHESR